MFDIYADVQKNRLYLTVRGNLSLGEVNEIERKLLGELRKLKTGFGIISDALDIEPATEEACLILQRVIQEANDASGVGNVVRISSRAFISNQWSLRRVGYKAYAAASQSKAEQLLDVLEVSE